jgi:uncharacterized protein YidB (DUF937 family)
MGLFDDAVPGGNIAKPVILALGTLLVGKLLSGASAPPQAAAPPSGPFSQPQQGGGLFGGLGGLLERLSGAGQTEAVNSWVGPGQNLPIPPDRLSSALGQTTIGELARNAGMSEQELLAQLARVLPGAVDKLTPNGRIPSQSEIQAAFER